MRCIKVNLMNEFLFPVLQELLENIKTRMIEAANYFFQSARLLKKLNHIFLASSPKVKGASMVNFSLKRLANLLIPYKETEISSYILKGLVKLHLKFLAVVD